MNDQYAQEKILKSVIREIEIETTMWYDHTLTTTVKIKKTDNTKWQKNVEKMLVRKQNNKTALKSSLMASYKLSIHSPLDPAILLLGIYWRNMCPQNSLYVNVHNSFIHNHLNLKTTLKPLKK